MWYLAQFIGLLDTTIDEVIEMNVEKLQSRYPAVSLMFIILKTVKKGTFD